VGTELPAGTGLGGGAEGGVAEPGFGEAAGGVAEGCAGAPLVGTLGPAEG